MRALLHKLLRALKQPRYAIARLLWVTGICRLFNVRLPDGSRIRFHPSSIACALWVNPAFRAAESRFLLGFLHPGATFVDVGANVGHLSVMAARAVGAQGRVAAVEPHPRVYRFLEENIRLNGLRNVEAHNLALGENTGTVHFSDIGSDDMNRVSDTGPVAVRLDTLDSVLRGLAAIDLLKIDAEGYELPILKGAGATLERTRCLVLEASAWQCEAFGYTKTDLREWIQAAGMRVVTAREGSLAEPDVGCGDAEFWLAYRDPEVGRKLEALAASGGLAD